MAKIELVPSSAAKNYTIGPTTLSDVEDALSDILALAGAFAEGCEPTREERKRLEVADKALSALRGEMRAHKNR